LKLSCPAVSHTIVFTRVEPTGRTFEPNSTPSVDS
jgi:hypothetical protein